MQPNLCKADQPDDGKANVLGERMTPEKLVEALEKAKALSRLPCWAHLEPLLQPVDVSSRGSR
jgi:hypothetical protein